MNQPTWISKDETEQGDKTNIREGNDGINRKNTKCKTKDEDFDAKRLEHFILHEPHFLISKIKIMTLDSAKLMGLEQHENTFKNCPNVYYLKWKPVVHKWVKLAI